MEETQKQTKKKRVKISKNESVVAKKLSFEEEMAQME